MRALHGETLLTAWEHCHRQSEPMRALVLLETAVPGRDRATLADLPLAERNRLLLELRAISFGRRMEGFAVCEQCGAQLEFAMDAHQLAERMLPAEPLAWRDQEREYSMRPANTADLLACMSVADEDEARRILLSRTMRKNDQPTEDRVAQMPDGISTHLPADGTAQFEALNASAEIQLALRCDGCGGISEMDLDIAQFLGRETSIAARRLLNDIHRLAMAYGWSEDSILAMSTARRTAYLTMLEA